MRIKGRQHSLNRSLRGFLVINLAGVVGRDRIDGFVVIVLYVVSDGVKRYSGWSFGAPKVFRAPARYGREKNDCRGNDNEFSAHKNCQAVLLALRCFPAR